MNSKFNSIYFNEFDYLAVFAKGTFSTEIARELIDFVYEEMKKHECRRVFFDVSDTVSMSTSASNYEFASQLPIIMGEFGEYKWAVYYSNDVHIYESASNILQNLGLQNLRISPDKNDVMEWLLSDSGQNL